jgi:hypothetical protein
MLTELRTRAAICSDLLGLLVLMAGCAGGLRAGCAGNVGAGQIVGAGHVADDLDGGVGIFLGMELAIDGGEGAEQLVGDVGEYGGAAGGDFVLGEEEEQAREELLIWAAEVKSSRLAVRVEAISEGSGRFWGRRVWAGQKWAFRLVVERRQRRPLG